MAAAALSAEVAGINGHNCLRIIWLSPAPCANFSTFLLLLSASGRLHTAQRGKSKERLWGAERRLAVWPVGLISAPLPASSLHLISKHPLSRESPPAYPQATPPCSVHPPLTYFLKASPTPDSAPNPP